MDKNRCLNQFKSLKIENKYKKLVYVVENKEERKYRLNFEAQNKIKNSNVINIDKINNCGSLYIKDLEIKYLRKEAINQPQICTFKPLSENLNPFLVEKFDLTLKRFIDLKVLGNTEENFQRIFSLDSD